VSIFASRRAAWSRRWVAVAVAACVGLVLVGCTDALLGSGGTAQTRAASGALARAARETLGARLRTSEAATATGGIRGNVLISEGPYDPVWAYRLLDALASSTTTDQVLVLSFMLPAPDGTGEFHSYYWNASEETRTVSWGQVGAHSITVLWGRSERPSFSDRVGSGLAAKAGGVDPRYVSDVARGIRPPPKETKPKLY
jgi:hypothetical protein